MADKIAAAFSYPERNSEVMDSFGYRLRNQFSVHEAYRRPKELQWLEDLRAFKGLYDPDVKIETNNSKVYPKITRSKVNIVLSRLHEMLFPETDKNWEVLITPEPRVSKEVVRALVQSLIQPDPETGEQTLPTVEDVRMEIIKFATKSCERMSSQIDDQFTEMNYPEETKKVLRSGLMYGTGIMKGPLITKRTKRRWEPDSLTGEFTEQTATEEVPYLEFTRVWDWYPDMSTVDHDKMTGSYERHIMTKHDVRQLMKRDDFYADIIKTYLEDHPHGNYTAKNWEVDLQVIEIEAGAGKTGSQRALSSSAVTGDTDLDENSRSTNRPAGKKYEVLEYWGYIDGEDLAACGLEIDDVELEYGACIWLLGNKVIKAVLFDTPLDQYKLFYYEKDETSIFGEGLARIMRHSQIAIAGAARMVLDNGACVSGPNLEVNWSLMTPDTDINSIYPRKIWFREGRGIDAQYPAIRSLQFDSHIAELLTIIQQFKQFGDEETTLPTWMIGQMTNNETAQATSSRMALITISIKDVVKNFDAFTEKIIKDLYAWNMEFNPRQDIKGDYQCKARGVSSLVMKEIRMQALNQLATTMTPEDWDYVDRRDFLKERFKTHDIVLPLKTEEEVQKIRQDRANSQAMQLAIKMQMAEIEYKQAQTVAQLAKGKEKSILADKEAMTPIESPPASDPRMMDAELQAKQIEMTGKEHDIMRQDERHMMDQKRAEESHRVKIATESAKTVHDMALKEKMTDSTIKTKATAAKTTAKPKKTAKKE